MHIKILSPSDTHDLATIYIKCRKEPAFRWPPDHPIPTYDEAFDNVFAWLTGEDDETVLGAYLDGELVGFALVDQYEERINMLRLLYLEKVARGTGLADELMEAVVDLCSDAEHLELFVCSTNHRARCFYAKHRFVEVGRAPSRIRDEHGDADMIHLNRYLICDCGFDFGEPGDEEGPVYEH